MPSRRAALAGIAVVLALVVGVEAVKAGGTSTEEVLSVGVQPVYPVAPIVPGATACQRPLGVTESFDRVRFNVGTFGKPGPALLVSVVDQDSKQTLGWGRVVPGWVDNGTAKDVKVGTIRPGHLVAVCVRNDGPVRAYVYGDFYNGRFGTGPLGVTPTNTTNSADVDDVPMAGDESIALLRTNPPSLLARVPALFRHAAAFRPPFVGAWTFWLLAALALVGAPFALWAAVTRVADAEQPREDGRYPDSPRP